MCANQKPVQSRNKCHERLNKELWESVGRQDCIWLVDQGMLPIGGGPGGTIWRWGIWTEVEAQRA